MNSQAQEGYMPYSLEKRGRERLSAALFVKFVAGVFHLVLQQCRPAVSVIACCTHSTNEYNDQATKMLLSRFHTMVYDAHLEQIIELVQSQ